MNRETYPKLCANCGGQYDNICFSAKCKEERAVLYVDDFQNKYLDVSAIPGDPNAAEKIDREKPTLKVFEIRILERHHDIEVIVDIVLILSTDEETALSQIRYTDKYYVRKVKEIEGPFKSGSILSDWSNLP